MLTVNFKEDNDSINLYPPNLILKVYSVGLYRQICVSPKTGYMVLDNTVSIKKSQIIWILLNGKKPHTLSFHKHCTFDPTNGFQISKRAFMFIMVMNLLKLGC